jgi:hypothetical protein
LVAKVLLYNLFFLVFFLTGVFMKKLFFFALLISCASNKAQTELGTPNTPTLKHRRYEIGDCLMIVDLPSGQTHSRHRVKIVSIDSEHYHYRWLLDSGKWAQGASKAAGRFETLEKISKKVFDCPSF